MRELANFLLALVGQFVLWALVFWFAQYRRKRRIEEAMRRIALGEQWPPVPKPIPPAPPLPRRRV